VTETKTLGLWLTKVLKWTKNTKEICINSYLRVSLLTKLKYVGVKIEDLIEVYNVDYSAALEMTGLITLHQRREDRCLSFALKSLKHPVNRKMFPLNMETGQDTRNPEMFTVNFARTDTYMLSSIPDNQRRLNRHFQ
jgi:hypothetical protein